MPEIFESEKTEVVQEIADLEKSGRFSSSFGSLVVTPKGARFESQEDDEKIYIR